MKKRQEPKAAKAKPTKATQPTQPITTTELATMNMSQAEIGSALLSEARNRQQKVKLDKAVGFALTIYSSLEECDRKIEYFTGWKDTLEGQLAALNAGAFNLDSAGKIIFDDVTLNRN